MRVPSTLLTIVLGALAGGVLWADDQRIPLRVWTFRLPGTELGTDVADLDGDGDKDLVVAHMKAPNDSARQISIYLQGPRNARFKAEPEHRFDVPTDACAFVAADLAPSPGAEVAFLCPTRVVIFTRQGRQEVMDKVRGFFDYPEQGGLPVWDLARDLDGDKLPELIVPTKTGYSVYGRASQEAKLTLRSQVKVTVDQRFGPAFETKLLNRFLSSSLRLRRVVHADLNGDGRQDLIAYREKGLARFLQRKDGTFPDKPDREDPLDLVAKRADGKETEDGNAFANVRLNLADVDGDGLTDLLGTRTLGEAGVFETLRTQQLVFLGRKDLPRTWDERKPAAVINLKGLSDDPILIDWDGDGLKDLVLGSYRMDMWTNLKRAIMESLTISYVIFLQRKDKERPFADEPDLSLDVEVPLESLQQRGGHRAVIFHADVDGDGIRDQIARRQDGGLQIARGEVGEATFGGKTHSFSSKPQRLSLPSTEPPWVIDLDGDGSDELILEPFGGDDAPSRVLRVVGKAR